MKSQEIVQDFLQHQQADFRCQKQSFQIVPQQNVFHTPNRAEQHFCQNQL